MEVRLVFDRITVNPEVMGGRLGIRGLRWLLSLLLLERLLGRYWRSIRSLRRGM